MQEGFAVMHLLCMNGRKRAKLRFAIFYPFFLEIPYFFAVSDGTCCFLLPIFAAGCLLRVQESVSSGGNAVLPNRLIRSGYDFVRSCLAVLALYAIKHAPQGIKGLLTAGNDCSCIFVGQMIAKNRAGCFGMKTIGLQVYLEKG